MKRFAYVAGCVMISAAAAALAAAPAGDAAPVTKRAARAAQAAPAKVAAEVKAAAEAPVTPVAGLNAAQIIEKNVAARGGLAAWRAVNSITMSGQMDAGGKSNARLPFVMTLQRPNKSRLEIQFQNQAAVQVFDGAQGWKLRPYMNRDEAEPYTPAEAKLAGATAELDGMLIDYAKKGTKVELMGAQAVEGKNAYKLKLTLKDGTQRHLWLDAASFLEMKVDGDPRKMDGRMRQVAIYYRDYKAEKGLAVARVLETVVEGVNQASKINIETVAINQPVDEALFAKPQLIAKVAGK